MSADAETQRAAAEAALIEKLSLRIHPDDLVLIRNEVQVGVAKGIAEGIAGGLTEENVTKFWNGLGSVVHRQAKEKAGALVLGGLTQGARRAFWISVFVVAVWTVFGTKALFGVWAALRAGA